MSSYKKQDPEIFSIINDEISRQENELQMIASEKDTYDVVKLAKLAQFRDKLRDERNVTKNRVHGRNRRGVTLVKRDGSVGTGPYTMEYRQKLLTSLTDLQEEVEMELISENEIKIIKQIWNEELIHLAKLDAGKAASDGDDA